MTRFVLLILIVLSFIAGSCSSRKNKLDHSNLIPEKELVSLLNDIYISGGLLTLPKINAMYSSLDSISTYIQVIEKHGYTKQTMDKTIKYYLVKNPKKLIKIYDQVLGILSEKESLAEKATLLEQARISNLWRGKDLYSFPDSSEINPGTFEINPGVTGTYTLQFTATLFPDDQSVNPRITVYSCNSDSIETGKRKYIKTINYIKDGQPHTYSLVLIVPDKTKQQFRGCFFDFDNHPDEWAKHLIIRAISFTYSSTGVV